MSSPTEFTLTTGDVAAQLGASKDSVARWADQGLLEHQRAPINRGHRKFRQVDVDAFADRMAKDARAS